MAGNVATLGGPDEVASAAGNRGEKSHLVTVAHRVVGRHVLQVDRTQDIGRPLASATDLIPDIGHRATRLRLYVIFGATKRFTQTGEEFYRDGHSAADDSS